ncbi:unnamed protein product [Heterosigma akashiwo]
MPVDALVRLTQLQGALGLLVGAVQKGDLSLDRYLDRLRDRVVRRDKIVLALALKRAGRTRDAAAVLRRLKTMQAEIAGAEEAAADEEDEEEGA